MYNVHTNLPRILSVARLLRIHHWTKNLLVFVPVLAGHQWSNRGAMERSLVAFGALCLAASAGYIANDLFDVHADRRHPAKRQRPVASGELTQGAGVVLCAALAVGAVATGFLAGRAFLAVLACYLIAALVYSAWVKRAPVGDVLMLAGFYVLRIVAGGAAAGIVPSTWLLGFSVFLFLSVAIAKRCAELKNLESPADAAVRRRGYCPADVDQLMRFGTVSAYLSVLVLSLYIQTAEVEHIYDRPLWLWALTPVLLYWTSHLWLEVSRGTLHEDPVVFALKDRASWVCLTLSAVIFVLALNPVWIGACALSPGC